ncbi:ATP-binding protein [Gordonia rhizosphera]|uniref:Bacterial transcriptional activator domain-containing protein n=1 Tax=Gordonia rhizosphera NBRC 16068 TaxID=1108045 RepID=K6WQB6_9ACTN|nr:AAA family ATPase [Gordonia rhizosphera]GAB88734.1 hypothetical protein GORHZ_038_00040 [Gordonia rhizosphera NBRC 16068]
MGGAVPDADVETDAERFERAATSALRDGDPAAAAAAADEYPGELLPLSLYEDWTADPRRRLGRRYVELLRLSEQWERLLEVDPTDEPAYRALMRRAIEVGNRHAAIRWYGRARTVLGRELGVRPDRATHELYERCVAGMTPAEPDFVGRDVEVARVRTALRARSPGLIVICGEAGIGKTALLRRIGAIATLEGWRTLCVSPPASGGPYASLVAAVEQAILADRALLDRVDDRTRSVLAELTPLAAPADPLEQPLTRHQVIGALGRVFADHPPVVLCIDDAQDADSTTIDAIPHLVRSDGPPLLVVLARRPMQDPNDPITHRTAVDQFTLTPLDREEILALVAASAPTPLEPQTVDRIIELAQGNPLFAVELARAPSPGPLPPSLRAAVDARCAELDDTSMTLLRRLALAGGRLSPSDVVAMTGTSEEDAYALLDAALGAGVLVVFEDHYVFRHELVRQALIETVPPHQRIAVHRDAARRLAEIGGEPHLIARHWLAGERPAEAVDWLRAAALHAIRLGAFADAIAELDLLLAHLPDDADALRLRAEALDARGDTRAPTAFAAAARAVGEPGAHEIRAKQALAELKHGDPAGALLTLARARPITVEGRLNEALTLAGAAAIGFGDPVRGSEKATECHRLALRSGDPVAVVQASWAKAAAAHALGDLQGSIEADLVTTATLPDLAISVFDGQVCINERLLYGARPYPEVIAFADSLSAQAHRLGAARGEAFAATLRGEAELLSGDLDSATVDLDRSARMHRAIGAALGEAFALQRRSEVELGRGRVRSAMEILDESLSIARESEVGFHLFDRIYGTRISAADSNSDALGAVAEAEAAVQGPLETCPGCRITLAVPAAIATARAGDLDRAVRYQRSVAYLADVVMRLPGWYAARAEVDGWVSAAKGDAVGARRYFADAAARFAAAGQPRDAQRVEAHV